MCFSSLCHFNRKCSPVGDQHIENFKNILQRNKAEQKAEKCSHLFVWCNEPYQPDQRFDMYDQSGEEHYEEEHTHNVNKHCRKDNCFII